MKKLKTDAVKLWKQYCDSPQDQLMTADGLERLYNDLSIDLEDIATLAFAWKLGATRLCEFTQAEFVEGLVAYRVHDLNSLRNVIFKMKADLDDARQFKDFYMWCFTYFNKDPSFRTIDLETAKSLWKEIMKNRYEHLNLWLQFLDTKVGDIIPRFAWSVVKYLNNGAILYPPCLASQRLTPSPRIPTHCF